MNYLDKMTMSKTMKYISNKYKQTNIGDTISVLEPISTIIKLGLLSFKCSYTKISIHSNKINIQEPYITQGFTRYINNDKRSDIAKLYIPILKAIDRYDDNFKDIFTLCIKGLVKLKQCYLGEDNINVMIDSYINLMSNCISHHKQNLIIQKINKPDNTCCREKNTDATNTDEANTDATNTDKTNTDAANTDKTNTDATNTGDIDTYDTDKIISSQMNSLSLFNDVWNLEDLKIINNYIYLLEDSEDLNIRQGYIEIIEKIVQLKETISKDIINKAYQLF